MLVDVRECVCRRVCDHQKKREERGENLRLGLDRYFSNNMKRAWDVLRDAGNV